MKKLKKQEELVAPRVHVVSYAERENNFVILISESQSAILQIPVYQVL